MEATVSIAHERITPAEGNPEGDPAEPRAGRAQVDEAEIARRMEFADGALGAAGHQVTDPALRALRRRVAAEEITAEEAIALAVRHIDAQ